MTRDDMKAQTETGCYTDDWYAHHDGQTRCCECERVVDTDEAALVGVVTDYGWVGADTPNSDDDTPAYMCDACMRTR